MILASLALLHGLASRGRIAQSASLYAPPKIHVGEVFTASLSDGSAITALVAQKDGASTSINLARIGNGWEIPDDFSTGNYTISVPGSVGASISISVIPTQGGNDPILEAPPTVSGGLPFHASVQDEDRYSGLRYTLYRTSSPAALGSVYLRYGSSAAAQAVAECSNSPISSGPTFYVSPNPPFQFNSVPPSPEYMYILAEGRLKGSDDWTTIGRSIITGPLTQ